MELKTEAGRAIHTTNFDRKSTSLFSRKPTLRKTAPRPITTAIKKIALATFLTLLLAFWCYAEKISLEIYGSTSPSGESGGIGVLIGHNPITLLYVGNPSFMGFQMSRRKIFEELNITTQYRLLGFAGTYHGKIFYRFQARLETTKRQMPVGIGILAKSGTSTLDVTFTTPTKYLSVAGIYGISSTKLFGQTVKTNFGVIYSPSAGLFGPYLALDLQDIVFVDLKCLGVFTPNVTYHTLLRINAPYANFLSLEISEGLLAATVNLRSIKIKAFRLEKSIGTAIEVPVKGR